MQTDVYNTCLWTGMAAFKCTHTYNMNITRRENGTIVPAMPDNILSTQSDVTAAITYILQNQRQYYDNSTVRQYDVRNIPPKIDVRNNPNLMDIVEAKHNSTHTVHPVKLLDHNIGSNAGLISVLRQIYEHNNMHIDKCDKYMLLNVDENIYWRILKVLFRCLLYTLFIIIIRLVYKSLNKYKINTGNV